MPKLMPKSAERGRGLRWFVFLSLAAEEERGASPRRRRRSPLPPPGCIIVGVRRATFGTH